MKLSSVVSARPLAAFLMGSVLLCGITAAPKITVQGAQDLPNVDGNGNIAATTSDGNGVLKISSKNGKFRGTVQAQVVNLSNAKQKYKNDPTLNEVLGIPNDFMTTVKKTLYKVEASGSAGLKISGVIDL